MVEDHITTRVVGAVTAWKKAHYTKGGMGWKESQRANTDFSKAQAPYLKAIAKVSPTCMHG